MVTRKSFDSLIKRAKSEIEYNKKLLSKNDGSEDFGKSLKTKALVELGNKIIGSHLFEGPQKDTKADTLANKIYRINQFQLAHGRSKSLSGVPVDFDHQPVDQVKRDITEMKPESIDYVASQLEHVLDIKESSMDESKSKEMAPDLKAQADKADDTIKHLFDNVKKNQKKTQSQSI